MELTGKCKKDFEEWLANQDEYNYNTLEIECDNVYMGVAHHEIYWYVVFNELPFSMQYGVYVDFFDENKIRLCLGYYGGYGTYRCLIESIFRPVKVERLTLHEARTEAIKKANKIYNEKYSN